MNIKIFRNRISVREWFITKDSGGRGTVPSQGRGFE